MDFNEILKQYSCEDAKFEDLPEKVQGLIIAYNNVSEGLVPNIINAAHAQASQSSSIISKVRAEIGTEALLELAAHVRALAKDIILANIKEGAANGAD